MLSNCEPEINELDQSTWAIHDIFWLDISMNDALRVTMLKSFEQIYHNFGRLLFIEWLLPLGDFLKQLTTRAKLHAKVNVFGIIVCLIVLDDVRMVNLLHELNLIFQTLEILRVQF